MKKKIIVVISISVLVVITLLIVLLLKNNNGINNLLTNYQWKDAIGNSRTLLFNKDGSGKYIDYDMKYSIKDDSINIFFKSYNQQEQNLSFNLTNEGNEYKIVSKNGESIYIANDDKFEERKKIIRTELVDKTPVLDLEQLWYDISNNEANAKIKYDSKLYKIKVNVMNIGTDHFSYRRSVNGYTKNIDIYMPTEDLAKLSKDMHITVLGQLNNVTSSPVLYNAFIADGYATTKTFNDAELKKQIELFGGTGGDGNVSWDEGSYPYFISNRDRFEKIDSSNFLNELSGTWKAKYYIEEKKDYKITFKTETTADYSLYDSDKISEWKYKMIEDTLYFPESRKDTKFEVRKASDNVFIFYTYTVDYVPYWILYKE